MLWNLVRSDYLVGEIPGSSPQGILVRDRRDRVKEPTALQAGVCVCVCA